MQGRFIFQKKPNKSLISIIIGMYPLLAVYISPIPHLDLGGFLLVLYIIYSVAGKNGYRFWVRKECKVNPWYFYVFGMTIMSLFLQLFVPLPYNLSISTVLLRYFKYLLLMGGLILCIRRRDLHIEDCIWAVRGVVHFSFYMVVIQQMVYFLTGHKISNILLYVSMHEEYIGAGRVTNGIFRPSALFYEPSHLAQYCLIYLVYVLFREKKNINIKELAYVAITILLTGSGIGLIVMAALVALWAFSFSSYSQKKMIITMLMIIAGVRLLFTNFVQAILVRIFTANVEFGGNAVAARIGFGYGKWMELPIMYKLIGTGFGNLATGGYMNGMECMLNATGIIGCLFFLFMLYKTGRKAARWQRMLLLTYFVLLLGSSLFNVNYFVIFLTLGGCVFGARQDNTEDISDYRIKTNTHYC